MADTTGPPNQPNHPDYQGYQPPQAAPGYQGYQGFQTASRPGLSGFLERLGDRARRRAEPRLGIALAGVGMLMILTGVLVWAGERTAEGTGDDGGSPDRSLGIILSLAVIVVGFTLLLRFKNGPLATAGVVASTLGVPVLLGFATFDPEPQRVLDSGDFDSFEQPAFEFPFQIDVIAIFSLAVWLVCYTSIPYARGRLFYLGASAFILWLYVLEKVQEGAAVYVATLPFSLFFGPFLFFFEEYPEPTGIGGWSVAFAALYYTAAVLLDRRGHRGLATVFVAAGFVIAPVGIGHLAGDLEGIGTGMLLLLAGLPLAYYGVVRGRRVTAWGWAFGAGLGLVVIAADAFEESAAGFGISAIVLGAVVVVLAHVLTERFSEPDEMSPGPSTFTPPPRPLQPAAAWGAYGAYPGAPPPYDLGQIHQPGYPPAQGQPAPGQPAPGHPGHPPLPGPPTQPAQPPAPAMPPQPEPPTGPAAPAAPDGAAASPAAADTDHAEWMPAPADDKPPPPPPPPPPPETWPPT